MGGPKKVENMTISEMKAKLVTSKALVKKQEAKIKAAEAEVAAKAKAHIGHVKRLGKVAKNMQGEIKKFRDIEKKKSEAKAHLKKAKHLLHRVEKDKIGVVITAAKAAVKKAKTNVASLTKQSRNVNNTNKVSLNTQAKKIGIKININKNRKCEPKVTKTKKAAKKTKK